MKITADNSEAKKAADEVDTYAKNKKPQMKIGGDNTLAVTSANNAALEIGSMSPRMKIDADTTVMRTQINNALLGPFNITVRANVVGMPKYTGTMLAPAHASGTLVEKSGTAYNTLNLIPAKSAFADGKVGLEKDETALVNELGTESLISRSQDTW